MPLDESEGVVKQHCSGPVLQAPRVRQSGGGATTTTTAQTTAGTYTFTVTGIGNDTASTAESTTFTLTVN